jgi:hypothetical protein
MIRPQEEIVKKNECASACKKVGFPEKKEMALKSGNLI